MAGKVSDLSDLIHRVASTCLIHHLGQCNGRENRRDDVDVEPEGGQEIKEEMEEERDGLGALEGEASGIGDAEKAREMEGLLGEVFEAVASVKRAYVSLQEAHCPWDPDRMRVSDAAVVMELRRLGRLRDRFRRGCGGRGGGWVAPPLSEAVAPYEAALEEMKRDLKVKEAEVASLKERLRTTAGKKGRFHSSKRRLGCGGDLGAPPGTTPTPELFEVCMDQVKSASKSFTAHLLSLMRAARWDISATVRSIMEGDSDDNPSVVLPPAPTVGSHHAKYALESYVSRKIFQGFENETFYMEGSLSSLLQPDKHRRDCYTQFRDMRTMDPTELLGILPTCHFGRFAAKKYLSIVHSKMEESLLGGLDHWRQVMSGAHPRTGFYGEYLKLAKAVWLLHLLAFALEPAPSHFEASKGAEFHPVYMESVVRFTGGRVPTGLVVGFPVGPGFKLGNGSVLKARVYPMTGE